MELHNNFVSVIFKNEIGNTYSIPQLCTSPEAQISWRNWKNFWVNNWIRYWICWYIASWFTQNCIEHCNIQSCYAVFHDLKREKSCVRREF